MPEHVVRLASEADVDGFRRAARRLLAAGVVPEAIGWHVETAAVDDLFAVVPETALPAAASEGVSTAGVSQAVTPDTSTGAVWPDRTAEVGRPAMATDAALPAILEEIALSAPAPVAAIKVPAFFVPLCERAALHADPARFGLLYRLLWRLVHEPGLRDDPLDPDRQQAETLARQVRRDMHKMTAFVRFRPVGEQHIAWFEPDNHIVEATAPFFARRFAQLRWAILTPERCVRWDGQALVFGPGARREDAPPADAAEQLWLTYYASIFNPARLKIAMMEKEMPRRYWKNLPEATLIHPLSVASAERSGRMVEQPAAEPARRRPAASTALRLDQREAVVHAPGSLEALRAATQQCRECPIGEFATQAVNGAGPMAPRLMLVGEQPGDQEDLRGQAFVGPAGQLLDRAFAQLGWPRDQLYVTNAVKHFKFELRGKRRIHKTPAQQEVAACLHWLESEIDLVKPQALVALGATAARALLGRAVPVLKERGQWLTRGDGLKVLVTLHPSALLRTDPAERDAAYAQWLQDLAQAHPPTRDAG